MRRWVQNGLTPSHGSPPAWTGSGAQCLRQPTAAQPGGRMRQRARTAGRPAGAAFCRGHYPARACRSAARWPSDLQQLLLQTMCPRQQRRTQLTGALNARLLFPLPGVNKPCTCAQPKGRLALTRVLQTDTGPHKPTTGPSPVSSTSSLFSLPGANDTRANTGPSHTNHGCLQPRPSPASSTNSLFWRLPSRLDSLSRLMCSNTCGQVGNSRCGRLRRTVGQAKVAGQLSTQRAALLQWQAHASLCPAGQQQAGTSPCQPGESQPTQRGLRSRVSNEAAKSVKSRRRSATGMPAGGGGGSVVRLGGGGGWQGRDCDGSMQQARPEARLLCNFSTSSRKCILALVEQLQ